LEAEGKMWELLFWVYLFNAVLLIIHEMDSTYWQEWEMFHLPGGLTGFLALHVPLLALLLYGLILVWERTPAGLILSLVLSLAGLFAFSIHTYFIGKGRDEFKLPVSVVILVAILLVSLLQAALTLYQLVEG
jgi:hypothetical protein